MKMVELHIAYMWTCEECGRDNFERGITRELNDEERQEVEPMGIAIEAESLWTMAPDAVTCKYCQTQFGTVG